MAKLHIWTILRPSKLADGDGTLSDTRTFEVTITDYHGKIDRGKHYEIREGTSTKGEQYRCLAGAQQKGDKAKFEINPVI
jgi:hypothetical protein